MAVIAERWQARRCVYGIYCPIKGSVIWYMCPFYRTVAMVWGGYEEDFCITGGKNGFFALDREDMV